MSETCLYFNIKKKKTHKMAFMYTEKFNRYTHNKFIILYFD